MNVSCTTANATKKTKAAQFSPRKRRKAIVEAESVLRGESEAMYKRNLVSVMEKKHHRRNSAFGHGEHRKKALRALQKLVHVDIEADAAAVAVAAVSPTKMISAEETASKMATAECHSVLGKQALLQHNLEGARAKGRVAMQERIARKRRMVETLAARFHELDIDADGFLNCDELAPLLLPSLTLDEEQREATLKALLRDFDVDGDGMLSMTEGLRLLHNIEKASMLADCVTHVCDVIARFDAQSDTDDAIDAAPFAREELEIMLDCAHSVAARALLSTYATEDGAELTADHAREVVHALHRERGAIVALHGAADTTTSAEDSPRRRRRALFPLEAQMGHLAVIVRVAREIDASRAGGPSGHVSIDEVSALLATTMPSALFEDCSVEARDAMLHDLIAEHDVNEDGVLYIDELDAKLMHVRRAARHEGDGFCIERLSDATQDSLQRLSAGALTIAEARALLKSDPCNLTPCEIDALIVKVQKIGTRNGLISRDDLDAIARQIALSQASAIAAADAYTDASAVLEAARRGAATDSAARLQARLAARQSRTTRSSKAQETSVSNDSKALRIECVSEEDVFFGAMVDGALRADLDAATEKVASLGTALSYSEERLRQAQTAGAEELAVLQSTASAAAVAVQAELRAEKERAQREVASFQEELEQQREAHARTEAAALRDRNTAQARIAALEGTIEAARSVTSDASKAGEAHEAATLRAAASKHAAAVAAVMEQLRASEAGRSASEQSVRDVKRQLTAAQAERDALVAREASAKAALEQLKAANVALQHDTACARAEVSAAATAGHSHEEAHVRELAQKHDEVLETLRRQLCTSEEDRDIARAAASSASSDLKHLREVNVELEASIAGLHSDAVAAAAGGEAADVAHAAALTAQHDAQMARAATKLRSSESHIKSLEAEAEVSSAKVRQLERATTRLESELTAAAEHASLAASDGQRHEDQHVRALARNHAAEVAKMQARLDDARARIVHPATSPSFSTPSASPSRSTPSRLTKGSPRAAAAHKFEEQLRLVEDRLRTVSESIGEYVARCSKTDAA